MILNRLNFPGSGLLAIVLGCLLLTSGCTHPDASTIDSIARSVHGIRAEIEQFQARPPATPAPRNGSAAAAEALVSARREASRVSDLVSRITSSGRARPLRRAPKFRSQLGGILEAEGKRHGAEIGVQLAKFTVQTLSRWKSCRKYIVIDLWEQQANYDDDANKAQDVQDRLYGQAMKTLAPYKEKVHVIRNWSHDAAKEVPDNSLDFVYIDARHDFESVLEDLRDWWPKCRVGCIFAGHDFTSAKSVPGFRRQRDGSIDMRAVRGAVEQFSEEVGRTYMVIPDTRTPGRKAPFASWVMRK